jgi:hypothetical protein
MRMLALHTTRGPHLPPAPPASPTRVDALLLAPLELLLHTPGACAQQRQCGRQVGAAAAPAV